MIPLTLKNVLSTILFIKSPLILKGITHTEHNNCFCTISTFHSINTLNSTLCIMRGMIYTIIYCFHNQCIQYLIL
nr:MAG TPA: hypothetical protein [Crassvirales sp.]